MLRNSFGFVKTMSKISIPLVGREESTNHNRLQVRFPTPFFPFLLLAARA